MSAQPEMPIEPRTNASGWMTFRRRFIGGLILLVVLLACGFLAWTWITLHFTYSKGERVGYIQKISKKGWVCKTWEGELAMLNQPGVPAQIFNFSVRDEAVAQNIVQHAAEKVRLSYEQHRGVPTSCFGDTQYFVTNVQSVGR